MSVGRSKIKKFNYYDVLDYEELEKYLSYMALEGWMISDIGNVFITFEKMDSRVVKFFVDITDKKIEGDNYLDSKEYKEELEGKSLEYVCGNDKFQIFINKGSRAKLDRNKLKFKRAFKDEFGMAFSFIIALMPLVYSNSIFSQSFKFYVSSNLLIIWLILGIVLFGSNLALILLKTIKYNRIKKIDDFNINHNNSESYNKRVSPRKYIMINNLLFLVITVIVIFSSQFGEPHTVSKDELPLKMEDLGIEISEVRESDKFSNSSFLAKYSKYYDYTYDQEVSDEYDEETESFYTGYENDNYRYLSYWVFESKHHNIIKNALKYSLQEYGLEYIKSKSKEELNRWGANEIYNSSFLQEKIVVYDNVIIRVGSGEELNENDIKIIKTKLLK